MRVHNLNRYSEIKLSSLVKSCYYIGMRSFTTLPTLIFLLANPVSAQDHPESSNDLSEELEYQLHGADSLVSSWVDSEIIPGAVLLVSKSGETLLHKAYGWSQLFSYGEGQYKDNSPTPNSLQKLDVPIPMLTNTRFDLASVTKVMATTFAVMLLVDQGLLDLDAPIFTYLEDFRGKEKDRITVRHLLTHRSGLQQWQPIYYQASNAQESYEVIRDLPLEWKVGEGYHYSDLGFMLLGMIVQEVTGDRLDNYLADQLYSPLGLTSTGFIPKPMENKEEQGVEFASTSHGNPYEHRMVHDLDFGYTYRRDPNQWNDWRLYTLTGEVNDGNSYHAFSGVAGHAGLFSNAEDLNRLLNLLNHNGTYGRKRYLDIGTVEMFWNAHKGPLGWQISETSNTAIYFHSGFTGTFVASAPAERLSIVLLTNRQNKGLTENGRYAELATLEQELLQTLTSDLRPPRGYN